VDGQCLYGGKVRVWTPHLMIELIQVVQ